MLDDHDQLTTVPTAGEPEAVAPLSTAEVGETTTTKAVKKPAKKAGRKTSQKTSQKAKDGSPQGASDLAEEPSGEDVEVMSVRKVKKSAPKASGRAKKTANGVMPTDPGEEAADNGAASASTATMLLFQAPANDQPVVARAERTTDPGEEDPGDDVEDDSEAMTESGRRRRRRGGRRRRKGAESGPDDVAAEDADGERSSGGSDGDGDEAGEDGAGEGTSRRRRRRRRAGDDGSGESDDPKNTVTKVRSRRSAEDEITAVAGSTRLEAKKQRRREGREAGRRRAPIVSEAEFLARRESVDRVMVVRQRGELTQIAVLEDRVLVEHYVARESQTSLIGNVYLGRVQNVLPSMEAAFVDIGKGRNAVLYAGEVNWPALGHKDGQPRKIESVLTSGQSILVQVTKDPVGHKGARLTSQISLAGRFLVYVPDGTTSGISRKLPDTERGRLKTLLKEIVPDSAGVIVRTAAEGASEQELTRDVERLKARWEDIEKKAKGSAPALLYGEPDLTLKVVRDLFTEDFSKLVIEGDDAWETVRAYVAHVAPDLEERLERYEPRNDQDVFSTYRVDEQIAKGLDRKVWLPSGGSLIIDRTEAMTVVDVNTGKFTGSGGNLEETVTRNNLEAADEIVRQLRLRDIGGIIVIDFIDMVLESNRDLVLRRLAECLGRDRTRHQVAEVTSLGLVQMTRKRIGTGLVEAFSETCEHCQGRGLLLQDMPVSPRSADDDRRSRRGRGRGRGAITPVKPTPRDIAAMARPEAGEDESVGDRSTEGEDTAPVETSAAVSPDPAHEPTPVGVSAAGDDPAPVGVEPSVAGDPTAGDAGSSAVGTGATVVVKTRRRSARRPAGPPSVADRGVVTDTELPTLFSDPAGSAEPEPAESVRAESDEVREGTAEQPQVDHVR
ncbi:MAG: Rne/Rng family ribonuclease [Nocardioides sp.]